MSYAELRNERNTALGKYYATGNVMDLTRSKFLELAMQDAAREEGLSVTTIGQRIWPNSR